MPSSQAQSNKYRVFTAKTQGSSISWESLCHCCFLYLSGIYLKCPYCSEKLHEYCFDEHFKECELSMLRCYPKPKWETNTMRWQTKAWRKKWTLKVKICNHCNSRIWLEKVWAYSADLRNFSRYTYCIPCGDAIQEEIRVSGVKSRIAGDNETMGIDMGGGAGGHQIVYPSFPYLGVVAGSPAQVTAKKP